ncbi:putative ABC transport system permease protein [Micrococcus sp. 140720015-1]
MKPWEVLGDSLRSLGRRRLRTLFSVIAVFVGAFTLALTMGIGTGVRSYIGDQLEMMGGENSLFVSADQGTSDGDLETYAENQSDGFVTVGAEDEERLKGLDGVESVTAAPVLNVEYVQRPGEDRFRTTMGDSLPGVQFDLAVGRQVADDASRSEVLLPESYVDDLGFASDEDALGSTLVFGLRDAAHEMATVEAEVVGVTRAGLLDAGPRGNLALSSAMHEAQTAELPPELSDVYPGFVVHAPDPEVAREAIEGAGYSVSSLSDQLGSFQSAVDGVVLILNIFAVLALVAAAFGIVNSLLMSVQERTREIGLLRALGMKRSTIFSLFSMEAVWIGLLGALTAVAAAVVVGTAIRGPIAEALDIDLPGLQLVAFDPVAIVIEVGVILALAFLAALLPAYRAAKLNPIDALRHE